MASNFLQRRFHLADEVLSRLLKLYQPYVQTIHNILHVLCQAQLYHQPSLNVCFTAFCNTGQNEPKLPVAVPIIFKTL